MTLARLREAWNGFWFEAMSPINLAVARVIVAAHALWHVSSRDYAAMAGITELWAVTPVWQSRRYLLGPELAGVEPLIQAVAVAALVGAIAGVYPRVCCFIAGLLIYHLAPLETVFWGQQQPTGRGLTLTPILLVLLAASRCGDALRAWPRRTKPVAGSWEHGWPIKLMWVLVAQIWLFAFIGKITMTGLEWASAEHMRRWFIAFSISDWWRFQEIGTLIADRAWIAWVLGVTTLIFQAVFVLAVFSRIARRILVPMAMLFSVATALSLNIQVGEAWLLLLFVNFAALIDRAAAGAAGSTPPPYPPSRPA